MESTNLDLEAVSVQVNNVNFDGLQRTRGDFVAGAVRDIFRAKTFGELILLVAQAQDKLRELEIFRDVGAIIDISKSTNETEGGRSDDGYDITFVTQEFSRITASAKTQMGTQADAQVKTGLRMPNLFGRGEKLEVEYSYSSGQEKNTEISFTKPFPFILDSSLKTSLMYSKSPYVHASILNTAVGSLLSYSCSHYVKLCSLHHKVEWEATWREITPANISCPFSIRLECGQAFKSALRHTLTIDGRDRLVFPEKGTFANFLQEFSGIGGDIRYHKIDVDLQHNIPLPLNMIFQTSFRMGVLNSLDKNRNSCGIADRFFMGGPCSLRGFSMRGIKIEPEGLSLGGMAHWSAAAHLYTPLPSVNRKFPIVDNCRLHFFVNGGNLADKFLARNILTDLRIAYGAGLAVGIGDFGRFEINYCWPVKQLSGDKTVKGLQVGVGVHFL